MMKPQFKVNVNYLNIDLILLEKKIYFKERESGISNLTIFIILSGVSILIIAIILLYLIKRRFSSKNNQIEQIENDTEKIRKEQLEINKMNLIMKALNQDNEKNAKKGIIFLIKLKEIQNENLEEIKVISPFQEDSNRSNELLNKVYNQVSKEDYLSEKEEIEDAKKIEENSHKSINSQISPHKVVRKFYDKNFFCYTDHNRSAPDESVFQNKIINNVIDSPKESYCSSSQVSSENKKKSAKKELDNLKVIKSTSKEDSDKSKKQTNDSSHSLKTEGNNKTISNKFDIKENRIITDFDDITKGVKFSIYRCPNKT